MGQEGGISPPCASASGVIKAAEVFQKLPRLITTHAADHLTCHRLPGEVVGKVADGRTCLGGAQVVGGELGVGHGLVVWLMESVYTATAW